MRLKYFVRLTCFGGLGYFIWGIGPDQSYRAFMATYEKEMARIAYLRSPPVLHKKPGADPRVFLAFTFDDGHDSVARWATPLLEAQGMRSTQFIITSTLSEDPWFYRPGSQFHMPLSVVQELHRRGHEMGSHTVSHIKLMEERDREKVEREIRDSRAQLAEAFGVPISTIKSFAAPLGSYGPNEVVEIERAGYSYAVTAWGLRLNIEKLNPYVIFRFNVGSEETSDDVCTFIDTAISTKHDTNRPILVVLALHYLAAGEESPPKPDTPVTYIIRVGTFKRIVECVAMRRDSGELFVGTLDEAVGAYTAYEGRLAAKEKR